MTINAKRIKTLAQEIGFHACGITLPKPVYEAEVALNKWVEQGKHGQMKYLENYDARKDQFWKNFREAKSVIVLGVNYFSSNHDGTSSVTGQVFFRAAGTKPVPARTGTDPIVGRRVRLSGRVARYAWGRDYHKVIARRLEELKQRIQAESECEIYFDSAVDTKPLLERTLAQRAGLGFIGKQTQLLSLQFGPWLFLAELITDLELEPDMPFQGSCGTCRLCIDECPTNAIEETGHIDARKCIAYLTIEHKTAIPVELRPKIKNWVFGCDECLNVCPYTAKQKETDWGELTAESGFARDLDLLKLFEIKSNREYRSKFSHSPISRANRKQLLRNACVVLGNSGSRAALPIVEKALDDSSLLVREHAQWAIDEIRRKTAEVVF
ncbi:MAG: tRNA epoxyqueuosine(34) reductase QueG [Candidatus Omnitrophica bacterium]|nr:tRNA epoxyqueuosine(34) reductase QueG [Candidatus Omnitrophota bacterium]